MKQLRFSLLGLAAATAGIAAACGTLVYASAWLAGMVWAATLLALLFGLLCAILVAPARRGFWIGFALCGWAYVLIEFGPLTSLSKLVPLESLLTQAAEAMPQAKGVSQVTIGLSPDGAKVARIEAGDTLLRIDDFNFTNNALVVGKTEFIQSFVRTSHALIALLLAAAGGIVGMLIRGRHSAA